MGRVSGRSVPSLPFPTSSTIKFGDGTFWFVQDFPHFNTASPLSWANPDGQSPCKEPETGWCPPQPSLHLPAPVWCHPQSVGGDHNCISRALEITNNLPKPLRGPGMTGSSKERVGSPQPPAENQIFSHPGGQIQQSPPSFFFPSPDLMTIQRVPDRVLKDALHSLSTKHENQLVCLHSLP